jgi:hypothetical protein
LLFYKKINNMDEKEKRLRAKSYLEKLARGENPVTGEALPELEHVSARRIRAALEYSAGLLGQIVDGDFAAARPFMADRRLKEAVEVSAEPVNLSGLVGAINRAAGEFGMKGLGVFSVSWWLLANGYLEEVENEGKISRMASAKGNAVGIQVMTRHAKDGRPFSMNTYDAVAQRFVIEHTDEISERSLGGRNGK